MEADKQRQMMELFGEYRAQEARESWLNRETRRNVDNIALFEAMLRKAYPDTTLVVAGHHIMVMREGEPVPLEIASADTLIFDHDIAKVVWGAAWVSALTQLATTPPELRENLVRMMFNNIHGTTF